MRLTTCRCRSQCTKYDPSIDAYVGPGVAVPYETARRHALNDQRVETLRNFARTPTPPPLDTPALSDSVGCLDANDLFQEELYALEEEIAARAAWSPTDHPLVFLTNPGPSQEFTLPSPPDIHLSNHGPHALDPTNYGNLAYIENERRLCEILVHLRRLRHSGTPLERLEEEVAEGLAEMWRHKEVEWRRRRSHSIARYNGFPVVDTGIFRS